MSSPLESVGQAKSNPGTRAPIGPKYKNIPIVDQGTKYSCLDLQSTPPPSTGPLDAFFLSFSGFQYDPSMPVVASFYSLRRGLENWSDWDGRSPGTWREYEEDVDIRYQAALTKEFNLWFGGTVDDIRSWHSLCRAVAIHPLPNSIKRCRSVSTHPFFKEPYLELLVGLRDVCRW